MTYPFTKRYGAARIAPSLGWAVQHYVETRELLRERGVIILTDTLAIVENNGRWGWFAEGAEVQA